MRRRSVLLVLLGLASFVLGLLAVDVVTSDDETADGEALVDVVVAAEPLTAGEVGEDVLTEERYRVEQVAPSERAADALVTPSQLSGAVLTLSFAEGEQLRTSGLHTARAANRASIPEGFEAVSVSVDFVAAGADTIAANDRVNVFVVVREDGVRQADLPPYAMPRVELLLTNTLVLDVRRGAAPVLRGQPAEGEQAAETDREVIVDLAVDTFDAEKVIFASSIGRADLYLSRVRVDDDGNPSPPVESTPGVDFTTILAEEAGAAFRRSDG